MRHPRREHFCGDHYVVSLTYVIVCVWERNSLYRTLGSPPNSSQPPPPRHRHSVHDEFRVPTLYITCLLSGPRNHGLLFSTMEEVLTSHARMPGRDDRLAALPAGAGMFDGHRTQPGCEPRQEGRPMGI